MKYLWLTVLSMVPFVLNAQNLPKVQKGMVKAPANVKIDGKVTEWDYTYQAYNPTSRVFYTLANDKDNLYLIARMESERGNTKAILGGITLTIKPAKGAKSAQKDVAISFPEGKGQDKDAILDLLSMAENYKKDRQKTDSLKAVINQRVLRSFKEIVVSGIKEVSEYSIPIYNALGIQTAANFNDEMQYVYEMALPLKCLNGLIDEAGKVQYNISVNGTTAPKPGRAVLMFSNPAALDPESQYSLYSTNFNGEYILAK